MKVFKGITLFLAIAGISSCKAEQNISDDDLRVFFRENIYEKKTEECVRLIAGLDKEIYKNAPQELMASRHESVGSVRLLRTYGDHAARIDVSRRNGLRSTPSVGVQM